MLEEKKLPATIGIRKVVRIEAEDFRNLENYDVEHLNDRSASHRLSVRQSKGGAGRIHTSLNRPYAPKGGVFDIEVRYFDGKNGGAEFELIVGARQQGDAIGTGYKAIRQSRSNR